MRLDFAVHVGDYARKRSEPRPKPLSFCFSSTRAISRWPDREFCIGDDGSLDAVRIRDDAPICVANLRCFAARVAFAFRASATNSECLFSGRPLTYDIVHVNSEFVDQASGHDPAMVRIQTAVKQLTALSPAKVWIGLKNSDAVGLRVDLLAEVFLKIAASVTKIGGGELDNQPTGSSGFNNALLATISPLALTSAPVTVPSGAQLQFKLSARRTCSGGGHNSGVVRLWYNGQPIDTGAGRDAGSRLDATIGGETDKYFLRTNLALSTSEGSSRTFVDQAVDSSVPCGATPPFTRPFSPFGTWTLTLP